MLRLFPADPDLLYLRLAILFDDWIMVINKLPVDSSEQSWTRERQRPLNTTLFSSQVPTGKQSHRSICLFQNQLIATPISILL